MADSDTDSRGRSDGRSETAQRKANTIDSRELQPRRTAYKGNRVPGKSYTCRRTEHTAEGDSLTAATLTPGRGQQAPQSMAEGDTACHIMAHDRRHDHARDHGTDGGYKWHYTL